MIRRILYTGDFRLDNPLIPLTQSLRVCFIRFRINWIEVSKCCGSVCTRALYCTILYYTVLYCTILYCTVLLRQCLHEGRAGPLVLDEMYLDTTYCSEQYATFPTRWLLTRA